MAEIAIDHNKQTQHANLMVVTFVGTTCIDFSFLTMFYECGTTNNQCLYRLPVVGQLFFCHFSSMDICYLCNFWLSKLLLKLSAFLKVWEVQIWRIDPSTSERKDLVSTSRVTLLANLSTPQVMKKYEEGLKNFSSKL